MQNQYEGSHHPLSSAYSHVSDHRKLNDDSWYIRDVLKSINCPRRSYHSSVYDLKRNQLYIIFGKDENGTHQNNIWTYDINTGICTRLPVLVVPQLVCHTSDLYNDIIYIFGGYDGYDGSDDHPSNAIYTYNIPTGVFGLLNVNGSLPGPRWHHASSLDEVNGIIYITGGVHKIGSTYTQYTDVWSFNIRNKNWTRLLDDKNYSRQRHSCVYDSIRVQLLCTGGSGKGGYPTNNIWSFDLNKNIWSVILYIDTNNIYYPRCGHTSFFDITQNILYVMSGLGEKDIILPRMLSIDLKQTPAAIMELTPQLSQSPIFSRAFGCTLYVTSKKLVYNIGGREDFILGNAASREIWTLQVVNPIPIVSIQSSDKQSKTTSSNVIIIIISATIIPIICIVIEVLIRLKYKKNLLLFASDRGQSFRRLTSYYSKRFNDSFDVLVTTGSNDNSANSFRNIYENTNHLNEFTPKPNENTSSAVLTTTVGSNTIVVPRIAWDEIYFSDDASNFVIGRGSFGIVIKALWDTIEYGRKVTKEVAVKVITRSYTSNKPEDMKEYQAAMREVDIIQKARSRMTHPDHVICVYGIAIGVLPTTLLEQLNIGSNFTAIGIVMRYESGGSLGSLLSRPSVSTTSTDNASTSSNTIGMIEKIRMMKMMAKGLAELHAVGVVHGDIKPDNVLLSADTPVQVRLADFGISSLREGLDHLDTTLRLTMHTRGSPIYNAPEMLVNPYIGEINDYTVAAPSRRTDMYAFAILLWELLTEKRAYAELRLNEVRLCMAVHQGVRPSLQSIPVDCPQVVVDMMVFCWDSNRQKRLTAAACYRILHQVYSELTDEYSDVFITYHPLDCKYAQYLYTLLDSKGLKIEMKQYDMVRDVDNSASSSITTPHASSTGMRDVIKTMRAKVVVACISKEYQLSDECLIDLRCAKNTRPAVPILPIFLEANHHTWITQDIIYYCQLLSQDTKYYTLQTDRDSNNLISHTVTITTCMNDNLEDGGDNKNIDDDINDNQDDDDINDDTIPMDIQKALNEISIDLYDDINQCLLIDFTSE